MMGFTISNGWVGGNNNLVLEFLGRTKQITPITLSLFIIPTRESDSQCNLTIDEMQRTEGKALQES